MPPCARAKETHPLGKTVWGTQRLFSVMVVRQWLQGGFACGRGFTIDRPQWFRASHTLDLIANILLRFHSVRILASIQAKDPKIGLREPVLSESNEIWIDINPHVPTLPHHR